MLINIYDCNGNPVTSNLRINPIKLAGKLYASLAGRILPIVTAPTHDGSIRGFVRETPAMTPSDDIAAMTDDELLAALAS